MQKQERAFLEAIAADGDNYTLKLIYADWLDEQGDPRGQLIRLALEAESILDRLDAEFAKDLPQLALWKHLIGIKTGPLGPHPIEVVTDDQRPSGYRLRVIPRRANYNSAYSDARAYAEATARAIRAGLAIGANPDVINPPSTK